MNIRYSDYTDGDKNMERIAPLGKEIGVLTCAFRHSLATVLITEENIDPKTAQGILRHASSDITMDIYTHAQDDAKRKALEKFEARLVQ